jgi:hypothetical protein
VNSAAGEASPILVEYDDGRTELYFSSQRPGGYSQEADGATTGDSDIYVSELLPDGTFADPALADGLNTVSDDFRPNVRRDGLEIVFDSNRTGGFGSFDVWSAARDDVHSSWSNVQNAGPNVNSAFAETRPFLSWGGTTMYFGTNRPGVEYPGTGTRLADIFVTTRLKVADAQ